MADLTKIEVMKAKVAKLRQKQLEATDKATYLGWSQEECLAFKRRADRMAELLQQLARLDPTSPYD